MGILTAVGITTVLPVRSKAMNFCATPGIDEWLGAVLNDPRGAGFAKRLLLQEGFLDWPAGNKAWWKQITWWWFQTNMIFTLHGEMILTI